MYASNVPRVWPVNVSVNLSDDPSCHEMSRVAVVPLVREYSGTAAKVAEPALAAMRPPLNTNDTGTSPHPWKVRSSVRPSIVDGAKSS